MLRTSYFCSLFLILSIVVIGQTGQHWEPIEQTPKSEINGQFYLRDGGILAFSYFSNRIAFTDDKGLNWRFGNADDDFFETNYTDERDGLNGHYYYLVDGDKKLKEVNSHSLETSIIYSSSERIFNFTISTDHAYLYTLDSLKKVNLESGAIVNSIPFEGDARQMYVSEDKGLVIFTNSRKILQMDDTLTIIKEVNIDIEDLDDLKLSSDNNIIIEDADQFRHSTDLGDTWMTTEFLELDFTWRELGVKDYYIVKDSTVFIYDLEENLWIDTVYLDTYLNIFGASDALYTSPSSNKYQGLHYIKAEEGLVKINDLVGEPNVFQAIGLSDSTHFINRFALNFTSPSLFYQDHAYQNTRNYNNVISLTSGELVGSTNDSLFISDSGTNDFRPLNPPITPRDYIKKDHLDALYLFRYDGIWISQDKGETWTHECPDGYFPDFDVNARTIIPTAWKKYYGIQGSKILKYDYNTKNTSVVYNSSPSTSSINQFIVNLSGALFINSFNKISSKNQIQKRKNGSVEQLVLPADDISGEITIDRFGYLYIHSSNRVYKGLAEGAIWEDITGDLPSDVEINNLSVTNDYTIYLACKNGPIYKTGKLPSAVGDIEKNGHDVVVSPNPAMDKISLVIDQPMSSHAIIISLTGQVVWEGLLKGEKPNIDVSNLKAGMYFIYFSNKQYRSTTFVKN